MRRAGLVSIDQDMKWVGGRYYLQHLVRCVASLSLVERVPLRSVSWVTIATSDPFEEVRELLGKNVVVAPSSDLVSRVLRKIRRVLTGTDGARDLFEAQGIDVFFPIPPCEQSGTPYVFWLPDFQYLRRPDLMSETLRSALERYYFEHVHSASRIVLSSEDAQNDFAGVYPELLHLTHVVRFCSVPDDSWWSLDPFAVAARYDLPARFLIVCNQFTRHKNHLTLMEALRMVVEGGQRDVHLVCTGSTFDHRGEDYAGQVRNYLDTNGLTGRVHILGLIPRADQIALLRRAVAVLQPSWFEGWSTIIEDGKTLGKLILASDLPVHHEQLGAEHPFFLSLDNAGDWAQAISNVWEHQSAGPNVEAEQSGLARLELAKHACGLAFTRALREACGEAT